MSRIKDMWGQFRENYNDPHFASTMSLLKPQNIEQETFGRHSSVVVERGTRVFMFEGQQNRDRFVNAYRNWGAKPCADPLP